MLIGMMSMEHIYGINMKTKYLDKYLSKSFDDNRSYTQNEIAARNTEFFTEIMANSGIRIDEGNAIKNPVVAACINKKASLISQLPPKLYRNGKEVKKTDWQFNQLMNPNGLQNFQGLIEMMVTHHDQYGSFYAALRKVMSGRISEVLPAVANPTMQRDKNGDPQYYLTPLNNNFWFDKNLFSKDEVLYILGTQNDGVRGQSLVSNCLPEILLFTAASTLAKSRFDNDSSPSGFLSTDQILTGETSDRLIKQFERRNQGVKKAGKVGVLEQGLKFDRVGDTNKDSQLVELQIHTANAICNALGVPPQLLNADNNSNVSYDELMRGFYRDTLAPLIKKIEDAFNFILPTGYELKFDVTDLLKGDEQALATALNSLMMTGLITVNEGREKLGLPPVADGDVRAQSTSTVRTPQTQSEV